MITRHEAKTRLETCEDWQQKTLLETIVELWDMFGEANSDLQEALDLLHIDREKLRERTAAPTSPDNRPLFHHQV